VNCPACRHENRAAARFCEACGDRLARACPRCAEDVGAQARFCPACGAALADAAAASPPRDEGRAGRARAHAAPDTAERRHLTVLFADLLGSTELAGGMDPEEWRELVHRYHQQASETVTRFGGYVAQYLGDGLLAYFGWPQAHEDAAERAVRAGLAIVGAARGVRLPPQARETASCLQVRVGIHTGAVVVGEIGGGGRAETLALGETPNIAARVQAVAEADCVLITAATNRLVSGLFVVEDRGRRLLKGVRDPVQLQRVLQPSGVRSRLAASAGHGLTPFVGREEERRLLRARFEQVREGEGQLVLVTGEAGIGKSRLAQVLHEDLAGVPHTWLESGGAPYYTHTPFYAVAELLKQVFLWRPDDSEAALAAALERGLAAAGLEPSETLPLVAPLLGLPVPPHHAPLLEAPEVSHKRLLAALAAWAFGTARQQPMVIVLEDLQWVDPSTLELQRVLAEQGATAPLLLLYTARPEFQPPWPLRAHHTLLTLNRLPRRYVREMVAKVAVRSALYAELIEAVVARTDGVPLFVEELTKAVAEAGAGAAVRDVPETLQDSLMARIDRLGPEAKEVAQVGAVCGREFSGRLLGAVHGVAPEALAASLQKLCDAELLYARGLEPDASYLFKHALVQEAAYQTLLKSRRREIHARVAAALAEHFPEVAAAQPELLAHHNSEAGDASRAAQAWLQAGELAMQRGGAAHEAESHLLRGLEMVERMPAGSERDGLEFRLQLQLGYALVMTRGYGAGEVQQAHRRAQALGEGLGDPVQVATLLMGLWLSTYGRSGPAAAQPLADQVLAMVERAGLEHLRIWPHLAQGMTRFQAGDLAGAREHLARGRALHCENTTPQMGLDPLVGVLVFQALTEVHRGNADQARTHAQSAIEWAERCGVPGAGAWARLYAAVLSSHLRDAEAAATYIKLVADAGPEPLLGQRDMLDQLCGWVLVEQGRLAEGIELLRKHVQGRLAGGERLGLEWRIGLLADGLGRSGQLEEALRLLGQAEGVLAGPSLFRPETLRLRAELLAEAAGAADPEVAAAEIEATFRSALDMALAQGAHTYALRTAASFARWLRGRGRAAEGRDLLAPIHAGFTEGFETRDVREAAALLDELGAT
jgi:class 3 adenylate cyclase